MVTYLIKLTPLAPFFFGSEKTFGDKKNQNYFAKSNPFPQQTTVLGMLRKEILIQSDHFKENGTYTDSEKNEMKAFIGESFKLNGQNNFGKIKKLSPVFIECDNKFYVKMPLDIDMAYTTQKGCSFLEKQKEHIPFVKNYNPKIGLPNDFVSPHCDRKKFEVIFEEFVKVGNAKAKSEDDEDKFFKQLFYTLSEDCSFAFFAELDFELNPAVVFMGADNSSFRMKVEQTKQSFEELFMTNSQKNKITLLSDSLVDESIYEHCTFAITKIIDFRTLTMHYGQYARKSPEKYEMLERGSVLYYSDGHKSEIQRLLDNGSLQQIGYNNYK